MNCIPLLLAMSLANPAGPGRESLRAFDPFRIQGTWIIQTAERNGQPVESVKGTKLIFTAKKLTIRKPDGEEEKFSYELDSTRKPRHINLTPADGKELIYGVYDLDGAALRLCYALPGRKRPAELASKPKSEHSRIVLRREQAIPPRDQAGRKEIEKLQGDWKVVSVEEDGKPHAEADVRDHRISISDHRVTFRTGERIQMEGELELDANANPKRIDLTNKANVAVILGIYEQEADQLQICLVKPGKLRPAEFAAQAESGRILIKLKRDR